MYPKENNFKKLVPRDIIINPTVLLHWFLDDGFSTLRDRNQEYLNKGWKQRTKQVIVGFCSESFSKEDNEFLANEIAKIGIGCYVGKCNSGTGYRIFINQKDTNKFFAIIGPPPVKSLEYKWKII